MQTELIIVSEYCHKCHIEPSFIELLEEGGLINVHTEGGEHYLLLSELPSVERYSRMYYDLSINKYKKTEYVPVEYPPTSEIFAQLRELEAEIQKGLEELEGMV